MTKREIARAYVLTCQQALNVKREKWALLPLPDALRELAGVLEDPTPEQAFNRVGDWLTAILAINQGAAHRLLVSLHLHPNRRLRRLTERQRHELAAMVRNGFRPVERDPYAGLTRVEHPGGDYFVRSA